MAKPNSREDVPCHFRDREGFAAKKGTIRRVSSNEGRPSIGRPSAVAGHVQNFNRGPLTHSADRDAATRTHEKEPYIEEGRKEGLGRDRCFRARRSIRAPARARRARGRELRKKEKKNSPSPPVARSNSETAPPTAAGREGRHSPRVLSREGEKRKKMFSLASANCRRHGNGLPLQPHPPLLLLRCSDGVHARTMPKLAGNSPPCRFSTFLPFARFAFFLYFFRKEGKIPTAGDANFSEQH